MSFLLYIQSGNLRDSKVEVKEEIKEEEDDEDGVMEEFSEVHKDMMEPPNTRNPPGRCPRPLYSRDSTQEGHTIPHCYQVGGTDHLEHGFLDILGQIQIGQRIFRYA